VDHGHILAQQLNGLGEHLLAGVHVFHIQQVHRVQQDLQVGAADLVQHGAGTLGIVHDVLDHRFDGNGHAVLFGTAHHRLEVLDEGGQRSITAAFRAELVLRIGRTGLGAHHAASQQAGKPDVGVIFFLDGVQSVLVRVGQVEVVAQHGNVNAVLGKQAAQIGSVTGGEGARRVGNLLEGFAQGQVSAGKPPLAYQREHLLQGQLFGVVQTQAKLDHRKLLLALLLAR